MRSATGRLEVLEQQGLLEFQTKEGHYFFSDGILSEHSEILSRETSPWRLHKLPRCGS